MNTVGRVFGSEYIEWAKTQSHARFNLATSGVAPYPLSGLAVKLEDLEISGPSYYGYEPLQQALAAKCGVPAECVVAANGTQMANHLAMAAVLQPGDEVLIENPTYESLVSAARYLGGQVRFFDRRFQDGFAIDPREIARKITPRTRLIVITNLHNPTGAFTDEATLRLIREIARDMKSYVLVDEVYLDGAFELAPKTSFHLGEEFIATSSLTKIYGLSGLRCGWIVARPDLAKKMWLLNDLFGAIPAHTAELLSVVALRSLNKLAARSNTLLEVNRRQLSTMLGPSEGLDFTVPKMGTVVFPRLRKGSVEELCHLLRNKYETSVVPGRFFGAPEHFRVGIGGDTALLQGGLARLTRAVSEIAAN
jgi:aspartate/methionine/tyrosine aminotransferase